MRILVFSDSHGTSGLIEQAIENHPEAKHIFFLGDGLREFENITYIYDDKNYHIVSGNCDFGSTATPADSVVLFGRKILFTHGHPFFVKSGLSSLKEWGIAQKADLVLFGHTHTPLTEYDGGTHYVNPGSISARGGMGSYAVIDIESSGIMPIIKKI